MLTLIRLITALFVLILIVPQTKQENIVLNLFHESGFFIDYGEAKFFLHALTWISIMAFVLVIIIN